MKKNISALVILAAMSILSCREQKTRSPQPKSEIKDSVTSMDWEAASVKSDDYDQNFDEDSLPAQIQHQFPPAYSLLKYGSGDLNKDSLTDWLIALKHKSEDSLAFNEEVKYPRKLLIFIARSKNNFQLVTTSDSAIYCKTCGGVMGDPFIGFTIKNGYFSIENYGGSAWRWLRTITFKYSPENKNWALYKDGHESFHASDPEKISTTIYTSKDFGNVLFQNFNIYDENENNDQKEDKAKPD